MKTYVAIVGHEPIHAYKSSIPVSAPLHFWESDPLLKMGFGNEKPRNSFFYSSVLELKGLILPIEI